MKAIPFIETLREFRSITAYGETYLQELAEFYSQPFSMEMLANPDKMPEEKDFAIMGVIAGEAENEYDWNKYENALKKWQQAEKRCLFDGFKILKKHWGYIYKPTYEKSGIKCIQEYKGALTIDFTNRLSKTLLNTIDLPTGTLNDFISWCCIGKGNLIWKPKIFNKYFK